MLLHGMKRTSRLNLYVQRQASRKQDYKVWHRFQVSYKLQKQDQWRLNRDNTIITNNNLRYLITYLIFGRLICSLMLYDKTALFVCFTTITCVSHIGYISCFVEYIHAFCIRIASVFFVPTTSTFLANIILIYS